MLGQKSFSLLCASEELKRLCSQTELEWLGSALVEKSFPAGATIIEEGEFGDSIAIILEGTVDIFKQAVPSTEKPKISTLGAGAIFGEIALIDHVPRTAGVQAKTAVTLAELTSKDLAALAEKHPSVGVKIYQLIATGLTKKVKKTTTDFVSVALSARMSALGEMAGNIAHEINTPLSVIAMYADLIETEIQSTSPHKEKILKGSQSISNMVHRITKLIKSVRSLSRDGENDPMERALIQDIVEHTLELCQVRYRDGSVDLRILPVPADLTCSCRAVQISQVLLNLLNNAYDAVKKLPSPWVELKISAQKGGIRIEITDSGPGIPPEIQKKIFQSFFTTKPPGAGTGLGLNIALQIIEKHHGKIWIDTLHPHTRFVIEIPDNS